MNELALFAGAGGGILGGHLLGWRTICAVEWEQYPASVLCARQNDGLLPPFPIWDDVQTFDGRPWRGIAQVVSGGFPCQDISAAGRGVGITGERSGMWGHMARIIGEVRPEYAFVENSPMLTVRGLGVVLGDLSEMGYDCRWGVISASDIGANHRRERIWIVGKITNTDCIRLQKSTYIKELEREGINKLQIKQSRNSSEMAYTNSNYDAIGGINITVSETGRRGNNIKRGSGKNVNGIIKSSSNETLDTKKWIDTSNIGNKKWWSVEPNVGRVVDGVAARVDRLKAIGNGQVPLCAATAWQLLTQGD